MEKINFVNGSTPALNGTNLNKLQQNVEDVTGNLEDLETSAKENLVAAINEAKLTGGDAVPIYSIFDYDGETVPTGYEEVEMSGTNENGSWIKFEDGTMICTKVISGQYNCNQSDGPLYKTSDINLGSYAQTFTELPVVSGSVGGNSFCWLALVGGSSQSTSSPGIAVLMRPNSAVITSKINIIAIGRWK